MTRLIRTIWLALALGLAALPRPVLAQDAYANAEVSATGTLDSLNAAVTLRLRGRPYTGIHLTGSTTFVGLVIVEESEDNGANWSERYFHNGDNWVIFDSLPHPTEPGRTYVPLPNPADTHIRVRVQTYTSGSLTVTIKANTVADPIPGLALVQSIQSVPTTMDGLNDEVWSLAATGLPVGFAVDAGTFAGTLKVECNPRSHGNTTWITQNFFANAVWNSGGTGLILTNPNSALLISVPPTAACQRYRLRVSAYTSGSLIAHARVGGTMDAIAMMLSTGVPGNAVPFATNYVGGKDNSGNLRALQVDSLGALTMTSSRIQIPTAVTGSASPDYSTGEDLGGEIVIANACRLGSGYTRLADIVISNDAPSVAITGDIILFNLDPAATFTDNGTFPDITGDIGKVVARIPITSGDWSTVGTVGFANIVVNKQIKCGATSLWAVINVTSAVNLASTGDVGIYWNFERF